MKFKTYRQKDSMLCGVACLQMICSYHGEDYSSDALSKICFATKEGVSALDIFEAAKQLGLNCITGKIDIEGLKESPLPCILHWNQNHFVVLYKVKNHRFYVADPAKGKIRYTMDEFKRHWISVSSTHTEKGIAMFFEPTPDFGKVSLRNQEERRSMKFLWGYIVQYRAYFLQVILGLIVGCLLQLLMPFLTQSIVDVGIKNSNIAFIWLILMGELMIVIGRTATDFVRRWLILHISIRINLSLISDFFIKLLRLPMAFFDTKLMGDLLQRIGDHKRVETFLTTQTLSILFSFLSFIIFGVVLLTYNLIIFCVFLAGSILYGAWIAYFLQKRKALDYELFEKQAINQNKTWQFITYIQEIKLQGCEKRRRWEWEDTQADLFNVQMKTLKLQQTQEAGSVFINELKNIFITILAATAVIQGEMTLGMMLAVQYIIGQLNAPVEQLMKFVYSVQDVKISLERINEIHCSNNEESSQNQINHFDESNQSIRIENASFKYDSNSLKTTLEDITIRIPEGKVTAIVGASGSGKTTLIKLLLGYYKVLSGAIYVGEHNLNDYNIKEWRKRCGVVMQDGVIFSESIGRNIAVSDGDIDFDRLERAATLANIHQDIMAMPLKYDTIIGNDGVGISQGQKQRILIARAVYKNPDYIFLDEATNSLDAKNERTIVENLVRFYTGKTVVIVAHRLSTVKDADQIVVIDAGKVVETGTHAELISRRGEYYNLIKNQLELGN
jgi:ATP-binding cassette subfamily B protein